MKIFTRFILVSLFIASAVSMTAQTAKQANQLFEAGKYAEALPVYEKLYAGSPNNLLYTYRVARCLQEAGRYAEALPLFEKTEKKYTLSYFFEGECFQAMWKPDDAIAAYRMYIIESMSSDRTEYVQEQIAIAEKRSRYIHRVLDVKIIDSVYISKSDLLRAYPLSKDAGTLTQSADGSVTHTNQRGDKRFFAQGTALYQQSRLLSEWERAEILPSTVNRGSKQDYPFCMSDGTTLYFAAQAEDGMGGWDIYMTRYNPATNTYAAAENIGFPFNSEGNDYLYVIDEQMGVGYFATDRRCTGDQVCVYTFLAESKQSYLPMSMPADQLASFAQLKQYHRAERPVVELQEEEEEPVQEETKAKAAKKKAATESSVFFIVDDNTVYTKLKDFQNADAKDLYNQYAGWQKELTDTNEKLVEKRRAYFEASAKKRLTMTRPILELEKKRSELQANIDKAAKKIRKLEK